MAENYQFYGLEYYLGLVHSNPDIHDVKNSNILSLQLNKECYCDFAKRYRNKEMHDSLNEQDCHLHNVCFKRCDCQTQYYERDGRYSGFDQLTGDSSSDFDMKHNLVCEIAQNRKYEELLIDGFCSVHSSSADDMMPEPLISEEKINPREQEYKDIMFLFKAKPIPFASKQEVTIERKSQDPQSQFYDYDLINDIDRDLVYDF